MRLVTAGSALECPCTIWLPAMHCIHPLYIWHPATHSTIYPCATIQPATIEVTLEKSVRAALKRNVGIATEQPLLPVSLPRLSRQCDFLTRKWLDNWHEEASLMCRESTVLDKEERQKLLRHYEILDLPVRELRPPFHWCSTFHLADIEQLLLRTIVTWGSRVS